MLFLILAVAPLPERVDYPKVAAEAKWEWKDDEATLAHCLKRHRGPFTAEVVGERDRSRTIRFSAAGKEPFILAGHAETVFSVAADGVLYYADHSPYSTGCRLLAVDLNAGKTLWKAELQGLGPIDHTRYRNRVTLDLLPDGTLRVFGRESSGDYVEYVDGRTGKTVGHKLFPRP